MFKVKDKNSYLERTVYGINIDSGGGIWFLIYENDDWKWRSSSNFVPLYTDEEFQEIRRRFLRSTLYGSDDNA